MTEADVYAKMPNDDRALASAIVAAIDTEPVLAASLIHRFYTDLDRANRTPRSLIYFHMGLLHGALLRTLANQQVDK